MNTDFQKILKRIAAENNTTPEDVYHEMQIAIDSNTATNIFLYVETKCFVFNI